jgi:hypothetical protein
MALFFGFACPKSILALVSSELSTRIAHGARVTQLGGLGLPTGTSLRALGLGREEQTSASCAGCVVSPPIVVDGGCNANLRNDGWDVAVVRECAHRKIISVGISLTLNESRAFCKVSIGGDQPAHRVAVSRSRSQRSTPFRHASIGVERGVEVVANGVWALQELGREARHVASLAGRQRDVSKTALIGES